MASVSKFTVSRDFINCMGGFVKNLQEDSFIFCGAHLPLKLCQLNRHLISQNVTATIFDCISLDRIRQECSLPFSRNTDHILETVLVCLGGYTEIIFMKPDNTYEGVLMSHGSILHLNEEYSQYKRAVGKRLHVNKRKTTDWKYHYIISYYTTNAFITVQNINAESGLNNITCFFLL